MARHHYALAALVLLAFASGATAQVTKTRWARARQGGSQGADAALRSNARVFEAPFMRPRGRLIRASRVCCFFSTAQRTHRAPQHRPRQTRPRKHPTQRTQRAATSSSVSAAYSGGSGPVKYVSFQPDGSNASL